MWYTVKHIFFSDSTYDGFSQLCGYGEKIDKVVKKFTNYDMFGGTNGHE